MKKLSKFFIKSFIGPFMVTFFISMFMLIMQFLWKYIDDLMGKGLEFHIILELLFYVSASLLPLALPLAILLSSLMVMGNLGESNELTALKSSGLSLFRILRPLTVIILFIAVGTFYFSNYVIPVANYKWHSLIWDIQEKKMTSFLKPMEYTQAIDGFSIKVNEKKGSHFKNIIIHDMRNKGQLKTIVADSGEFFEAVNKEFLFFKLYNGHVIEEMNRFPDFEEGNQRSVFPSRKTTFENATYKMDITGLKLQRSKAELFKDKYEMMNVFQIDQTVDTLQKEFVQILKSFAQNTAGKHAYFNAIRYQQMKQTQKDTLTDSLSVSTTARVAKNQPLHLLQREDATSSKNNTLNLDSLKNIAPIYVFAKMPYKIRVKAISNMKSKLRLDIKTLQNQLDLTENRNRNLLKFEIEFHRKFALACTIIVLFFIGAPLGAIIKRGGFGAPVVVAAILFLIYFVLISIGDNMSNSFIIPPYLGMWGPTFILIPIAIVLMIMASNDRSISDLPRLFKRKKKNA